MAKTKGYGVMPAAMTFWNADESYNQKETERYLQWLIDKGAQSLSITGSTGENISMGMEEQKRIMESMLRFIDGQVPVYAGTGRYTTAETIELSLHAKTSGADGVLVVSPYYNKATQAGLKKHFTEIAKAIDIPVILYNIPGRTGVNIQPKTIADMVAEVENIIGVKEASGDLSQVAELLSLTQGEIDVYSGNDDQIVPIVALGGKGVISVLSHVAPKDTHDMVIKLIEGDVEGSRNLQLKYIPLITALFSEVNPIPVKAAMELMGFQAGPLRMPLTRMEEAHKQVLRQAMIDAGVKVIG